MTRTGSLQRRLKVALSYGESLAVFQFPMHSFLKERGNCFGLWSWNPRVDCLKEGEKQKFEVLL